MAHTAGLDVREPSLTNDPNTVRDLDGFDVIDGEIRKSPGTKKFGNDNTAWDPAAVNELVTGLFTFIGSDGSVHLLGHSGTDHCYYNASTDTWTDLTGAAGATGGQTDFWDATSGYTDALPGASSFNSNNRIYMAVNGLDEDVFIWDGDTTDNFELLGPTVGGTTIGARVCFYFANRLILGHTIEGGTTFAGRVRWCASGDITNWDTIGAGANDVSDVAGRLQTGFAAGNEAFLMYENGIVQVRKTNNAAAPFSFTALNTAVHGLWARRSIASTPTGKRIYLAPDLNVYVWDPADPIRGEPTPIGNPIREKLRTEINRAKRDEIWGLYNPAESSYKLAICSGDSDYPNIIYSFNFDTGSWSRRTLSRSIVCATAASPSITADIDSLGTDTIDSLGAVTINSLSGSSLPTRTVISIDSRPQSASGTEVATSRILSFERGRYSMGFQSATRITPYVLCDTVNEAALGNWDNEVNCTAIDGAVGNQHWADPGPGPAGALANMLGFQSTAALADYGWATGELPNILGISVRVHGMNRATITTAPTMPDTRIWMGILDGFATGWFGGGNNYESFSTEMWDPAVAHTAQSVQVRTFDFLFDGTNFNGLNADSIGPSTITTGNLHVGFCHHAAASSTDFITPLRIDAVEWAWYYEGFEEADPFVSKVQTNFFDFDLPTQLKILNTFVITYRDTSPEPTTVTLAIAPNDNVVFQATTEGLNDRRVKRLVFRPMITSTNFSGIISHNDTNDLTIVGFEAHASVLGESLYAD